MTLLLFIFFFNDTATTEIYTLSLHDALPIYGAVRHRGDFAAIDAGEAGMVGGDDAGAGHDDPLGGEHRGDRKSTRLNSSHSQISYAVFCLKKKNHVIQALPVHPV